MGSHLWDLWWRPGTAANWSRLPGLHNVSGKKGPLKQAERKCWMWFRKWNELWSKVTSWRIVPSPCSQTMLRSNIMYLKSLELILDYGWVLETAWGPLVCQSAGSWWMHSSDGINSSFRGTESYRIGPWQCIFTAWHFISFWLKRFYNKPCVFLLQPKVIEWFR